MQNLLQKQHFCDCGSKAQWAGFIVEKIPKLAYNGALSCNGGIHFYIECTNQIAIWYLYNFTCAATLAVSILHVLYCLPHRADAGHLITTLTHPTSLFYNFVTVATSSLIAGRILWWCIIWIIYAGAWYGTGKWQCYVATANQSFFHKYMYKHWITFANLLLELQWLQGHQAL